jgi:hypothetical protein
MIVGSVSAEVYRRIEEYVRKAGGGDVPAKRESDAANTTKSAKGTSADAPTQPENAAAPTTKPTSEQNKNAGAAGASSPAPARATPTAPATAKPDHAPARETLRVGARVLAAYWNEKREFEGFWLATVKRIEAGEYILGWFDTPGYPAFKSRPQNIAVPHPEFRVSSK